MAIARYRFSVHIGGDGGVAVQTVGVQRVKAEILYIFKGENRVALAAEVIGLHNLIAYDIVSLAVVGADAENETAVFTDYRLGIVAVLHLSFKGG